MTRNFIDSSVSRIPCVLRLYLEFLLVKKVFISLSRVERCACIYYIFNISIVDLWSRRKRVSRDQRSSRARHTRRNIVLLPSLYLDISCLPACLPACARFLWRGGGEGSRRYCFAKIEIILSWFEHRTPRHVYLLFFLFFRILPNSTNFFCIKSKTLSVGRVRWQAPRMRRGGIHPEKKRPRRTESRKYVARNGES